MHITLIMSLHYLVKHKKLVIISDGEKVKW